MVVAAALDCERRHGTMTGVLVRWLITTVAVLIVTRIVSGVTIDSASSALLAGAILGVLNALVRPLLILLTLPLTIVTLGFFILVINALMFQLAGALVPGFHVASFWSAFWASIIVSIVSWLASLIIAGGGGERTVIVRRWGDTIDLSRDRDGRWR